MAISETVSLSSLQFQVSNNTSHHYQSIGLNIMTLRINMQFSVDNVLTTDVALSVNIAHAHTL